MSSRAALLAGLSVTAGAGVVASITAFVRAPSAGTVLAMTLSSATTIVLGIVCHDYYRYADSMFRRSRLAPATTGRIPLRCHLGLHAWSDWIMTPPSAAMIAEDVHEQHETRACARCPAVMMRWC